MSNHCFRINLQFLVVGLFVSAGMIFLSENARAQIGKISFEHYTVEDGLSAPVTLITQDHFGFLWLGTTDGLNRFDGNHFITYRNIPGDRTSITSNIINAIHVDKSGRIWVATNSGLCYYDFSDDQFHTIAFQDTLEALDRHRVHGVSSDSKNNIWFATRTMLHRWDGKQSSVVYPLPPVQDFLIKFLHIDEKDQKWIGSNLGLHLINDSSSGIIHGEVSSPFSRENRLGVTVHPIHAYHRDTLLIGTWYAGFQKVFQENDSISGIYFEDPSEIDPRKHIVSGISPGKGSLWWVGTYGNGLALFDMSTRKFVEHFHHNPSDEKSLSNDYINDVFTDRSGIVWIGTTKGLDKFDPLTQQFQSVSVPVPPGKFAVYRLINTIVEDRTNPDWLWLCVSGAGLYHYNKISKQFELYRIEEHNNEDLPSNNIYSFFYDHLGRVWIGTRSALYLFDTAIKKFIPPPLTGNQVKSAHTILQDREKNFWFATNSSGVYKYDEQKNELTEYTYKQNDPQSIPDNRIFCMHFDSRGKLWLGTQNQGLCRLDPTTNDVMFFRHDKNNMNSIPDNGVYDVHEDEHYHLWIATENGLARMDMSTFDIAHFTTNDGLCNNTVFSITPDHNNNLWLGTNNGFSHYNPSSKKFRNYYTNDGLPLNRIDGEVLFGRDSTLYFGTTGMLSYCKPDEMKMNKIIPPVFITDYSILGKEVPVMREEEMLMPIHLSHKENMITFNFAALNFSNAFLNQYAYKLEGFDEDWIYCGNTQSATYTNLNGGNYTFRVKGANNDGIWNEEGTYAVLYVHPPFWRTWWFYMLCFLAAASALYVFYRVRINQIMRLQNIRTRIARDLHDDIGSTLSSINMISSMANNGIPQKKSAELFSTISSASRQAMELMGDIVWSINPKNDRMEMVIIRMRQYASEILEAANIAFSMDVDAAGHDALLPLEKRKDFYLIFKEAVNNLAKYSGATEAIIRLAADHQKLELTISDNGKGFDPLKASTGNGLRNMKARANQLKGKLTISSVPSQGTSIELEIPLSP